MPYPVTAPLRDRIGTAMSGSIDVRSWPRSRQRCTANVTTIASSDGIANCASHCGSGGMWLPKITRFAGLEIGSTKLAALAVNALAYR